MFYTFLSVLPSVHQSVSPCVRLRLCASAIPPISIDGFSPDVCRWCILRQRWTDYFLGSKVKVTWSRWRRPALDAAVEWNFLVAICYDECESVVLVSLCLVWLHSLLQCLLSLVCLSHFIVCVMCWGLWLLISARQHAEACYMLSQIRLSICPSVRLSVRHTGGSVENGWS